MDGLEFLLCINCTDIFSESILVLLSLLQLSFFFKRLKSIKRPLLEPAKIKRRMQASIVSFTVAVIVYFTMNRPN